jgi:hypothetical protein
VNTLESGVLTNGGTGHLAFQALPRLAQIAPAFGAALVDVNHDGCLVLYLVQNLHEICVSIGGSTGKPIGDGTPHVVSGWRAEWL